MVPNQNVMPQHKTSAAGSHKMDDSAQSKNNSNLPLPEHFNINKIQTNAEVIQNLTSTKEKLTHSVITIG